MIRQSASLGDIFCFQGRLRRAHRRPFLYTVSADTGQIRFVDVTMTTTTSAYRRVTKQVKTRISRDVGIFHSTYTRDASRVRRALPPSNVMSAIRMTSRERKMGG